MPGRQIVGGEPYRYGYQGEFAETDEETGKPAFQLRLYDPRINRWMSPDPARQHASPYMSMSNNWANVVDPDGGCDDGKGNMIPCPDDGTGIPHQLDEVVIRSTGWYRKNYGNFFRGLSTVGNKLYGTPYHPHIILGLTEAQKQKDFKESAAKTTGILMMEFAMGTAPDEPRVFDVNSALSKDIKYSYSASKAIKAFLKSEHNVNGGGKFDFYSAFSPDKTNVGGSLRSHVKSVYADQTFWRGGMTYTVRRDNNKLHVTVHDRYTISSGYTRNGADDIEEGMGVPLSSTTIYVHITYNIKH
jgi:RHS repeat-associated protein